MFEDLKDKLASGAIRLSDALARALPKFRGLVSDDRLIWCSNELQGYTNGLDFYQQRFTDLPPYRVVEGSLRLMRPDGAMADITHTLADRTEFFLSAPIGWIEDFASIPGDMTVVELPELTGFIGRQSGGTIVCECSKEQLLRIQLQFKQTFVALLEEVDQIQSARIRGRATGQGVSLDGSIDPFSGLARTHEVSMMPGNFIAEDVIPGAAKASLDEAGWRKLKLPSSSPPEPSGKANIDKKASPVQATVPLVPDSVSEERAAEQAGTAVDNQQDSVLDGSLTTSAPPLSNLGGAGPSKQPAASWSPPVLASNQASDIATQAASWSPPVPSNNQPKPVLSNRLASWSPPAPADKQAEIADRAGQSAPSLSTNKEAHEVPSHTAAAWAPPIPASREASEVTSNQAAAWAPSIPVNREASGVTSNQAAAWAPPLPVNREASEVTSNQAAAWAPPIPVNREASEVTSDQSAAWAPSVPASRASEVSDSLEASWASQSAADRAPNGAVDSQSALWAPPVPPKKEVNEAVASQVALWAPPVPAKKAADEGTSQAALWAAPVPDKGREDQGGVGQAAQTVAVPGSSQAREAGPNQVWTPPIPGKSQANESGSASVSWTPTAPTSNEEKDIPSAPVVSWSSGSKQNPNLPGPLPVGNQAASWSPPLPTTDQSNALPPTNNQRTLWTPPAPGTAHNSATSREVPDASSRIRLRGDHSGADQSRRPASWSPPALNVPTNNLGGLSGQTAGFHSEQQLGDRSENSLAQPASPSEPDSAWQEAMGSFEDSSTSPIVADLREQAMDPNYQLENLGSDDDLFLADFDYSLNPEDEIMRDRALELIRAARTTPDWVLKPEYGGSQGDEAVVHYMVEKGWIITAAPDVYVLTEQGAREVDRE